jgi:hypothetical protein
MGSLQSSSSRPGKIKRNYTFETDKLFAQIEETKVSDYLKNNRSVHYFVYVLAEKYAL